MKFGIAVVVGGGGERVEVEVLFLETLLSVVLLAVELTLWQDKYMKNTAKTHFILTEHSNLKLTFVKVHETPRPILPIIERGNKEKQS